MSFSKGPLFHTIKATIVAFFYLNSYAMEVLYFCNCNDFVAKLKTKLAGIFVSDNAFQEMELTTELSPNFIPPCWCGPLNLRPFLQLNIVDISLILGKGGKSSHSIFANYLGFCRILGFWDSLGLLGIPWEIVNMILRNS